QPQGAQGIGLLLPGPPAPRGGGRLLRQGIVLDSAAAATSTPTVAAADPASPAGSCSSLQGGGDDVAPALQDESVQGLYQHLGYLPTHVQMLSLVQSSERAELEEQRPMKL
ncbi:unnamed protein product, partial [Urochloa humidicola]